MNFRLFVYYFDPPLNTENRLDSIITEEKFVCHKHDSSRALQLHFLGIKDILPTQKIDSSFRLADSRLKLAGFVRENTV
jgi:hypothetical protein